MEDTRLDGMSPLNQFIYRELPMDKWTEARKLIDSEVLSVLAELKNSLNDNKQSHSIRVINAAIEEQERRFKG